MSFEKSAKTSRTPPRVPFQTKTRAQTAMETAAIAPATTANTEDTVAENVAGNMITVDAVIENVSTITTNTSNQTIAQPAILDFSPPSASSANEICVLAGDPPADIAVLPLPRPSLPLHLQLEAARAELETSRAELIAVRRLREEDKRVHRAECEKLIQQQSQLQQAHEEERRLRVANETNIQSRLAEMEHRFTQLSQQQFSLPNQNYELPTVIPSLNVPTASQLTSHTNLNNIPGSKQYELRL